MELESSCNLSLALGLPFFGTPHKMRFWFWFVLSVISRKWGNKDVIPRSNSERRIVRVTETSYYEEIKQQNYSSTVECTPGHYVLSWCLSAFLCTSSINNSYQQRTVLFENKACVSTQQEAMESQDVPLFHKWASVMESHICVPQTATEPISTLMQVHMHRLFSSIVLFFSEPQIH